MAEPDKLQRKDIADLLFKKYILLKSEIHLHMSNYKKHSKSVQVVATAIYAAVSYLIIDGKHRCYLFPQCSELSFCFLSDRTSVTAITSTGKGGF